MRHVARTGDHGSLACCKINEKNSGCILSPQGHVGAAMTAIPRTYIWYLAYCIQSVWLSCSTQYQPDLGGDAAMQRLCDSLEKQND